MTICATARRRNGTKCETSAATTDGDSLTLISICKFLIKAFEQNTHLGSKASFSEGGQFNLDSCVCRARDARFCIQISFNIKKRLLFTKCGNIAMRVSSSQPI